MDAENYLNDSFKIMQERGKTYDKGEEKERSMESTVKAFNAITGNELTESEGWLFMLVLKQVRQWSNSAFHFDSALDSVSYAALLAESLEKEDQNESKNSD